MSSTITALTSGGGLAMAGDTSGQLELKTNNGTTAVTINTSQNVGVGMTDQTKKLETTGTLATRGSSTNATWTGAGELAIKNGSGNSYMSFHNDAGTRLVYMQSGASGYEINAESGYLILSSGGTERMRLTSDGTILMGTTTSGGATSSFKR